MSVKKKGRSCCEPGAAAMGCCKVESMVSVDERGQMVLPKELRDKAGIGPGDKLAVVSWEKGGKVCCLTLIKADEFAEMVKGMLGPVLGDIFKK